MTDFFGDHTKLLKIDLKRNRRACRVCDDRPLFSVLTRPLSSVWLPRWMKVKSFMHTGNIGICRKEIHARTAILKDDYLRSVEQSGHSSRDFDRPTCSERDPRGLSAPRNQRDRRSLAVPTTHSESNKREFTSNSFLYFSDTRSHVACKRCTVLWSSPLMMANIELKFFMSLQHSRKGNQLFSSFPPKILLAILMKCLIIFDRCMRLVSRKISVIVQYISWLGSLRNFSKCGKP